MFWVWITLAVMAGMGLGYFLRGGVDVRDAYNRGHDEGFALAEKQEEQRRSRAGTKAAATRKANKSGPAVHRTANGLPSGDRSHHLQFSTHAGPLPLDHPQRLPVGRDD